MDPTAKSVLGHYAQDYSRTYTRLPDLTPDPALAPAIEALGAQGKGLVQIAAELGIPSAQLTAWDRAGTYAWLCAALARARDLCAAWYLGQAQEGMWDTYVTKSGSVTRKLNDRLFVWVAERSAPEHLRQSLEIDIRALIGEVKQEDLPLDQLRRLAAGESPLAVLRPGGQPVESEPETP